MEATQILSSNDVGWIDTAIHIARSDHLPVSLITISVFWITLCLYKEYQNGAIEPGKLRLSPSLQPASHISRVTAFAFSSYAAQKDPRQRYRAVLVAYIALLGIVQHVATSPRFHHLLHFQANLMSIAAMGIYISAEVLPLAILESHYTLAPGSSGTFISLIVSVFIAAVSPWEWKPRLPNGPSTQWREVKPTVEETCSWLDYYFTFGRLTPLVWRGYRKNDIASELPERPWYDSADHLLAKLAKARSRKRKTLSTIICFAGAEIAATALYAAVLYTSRLLSPYGFYRLLDYLMYPESAKIHPYTWVLLMFAASMIQLVALQQHNVNLSRLNIRIKVALTAEIYQRALSSRELEDDFLGSALTLGASKPTASGQLANLISTDITMVTFASHVIMVAVGVPITVIFALIGLYQIVSWTSLVGLAIIIICFPLPTWIMHSVQGAQAKSQAAQDSRVSLTSEYLSAIRVVKYFAWEEKMAERINQVRAEEQRHLWNIEVLHALMREITDFIPVLALFTIFILYIGILKQPLAAPVAFTTAMLVRMIKSNLYLLSVISPRLTRASISLNRIDKFFEATTPLQSYPDGPLNVANATFQRKSNTGFQLHDISINFCPGGLNIVTGPSGSGKTLFLLSLLGEAVCLDGQVTRPRNVAYASQSPWLQAQSVRENILFGHPYESKRYSDIIHACCLSADLKELVNGDETEVGEGGTSLSGGQRARVALARALYSDAPVLLLDDVFSALDTKTSHKLWNRVFCTDLLLGRTTVLVSQVTWMFPQADLTVTLDQGTIKSVDQNLGIKRMINSLSTDSTDLDRHQTDDIYDTKDASAGETVHEELRKADMSNSAANGNETLPSKERGRLAFLNYMLYFGGPGSVVLAIGALFALHAFAIATPWWLSYWVDTVSKDEATNISFYLGVYMVISMCGAIVHGTTVLVFSRGAWVAARQLHNNLISAVMKASLSWYKVTPVSRILDRLSTDIDSLDQSQGHQLMGFLNELTGLLFQIGAVSSIFPAFLIPSGIATIGGFICGEMYNRTTVIVQSLVSASQSPIISHFSESVSGIAVIRANPDRPRIFLRKLETRLHRYARAAATHKDLDCWLQFRIDILASLATVSVCIMAIDRVSLLAAGIAGFSLSNARGLSGSILNMVGIMNDLDIEMQSFHRVEEYCKLPPEEIVDKGHQHAPSFSELPSSIPSNWPRTGRVEYRNVTIKHDPDGPDVLTNINLTFEAGKRIAIVGRTGSGKSTLLLSLLRLTDIVSGKIYLDGVDITTMPRKKLRRAISAIPQEAALFQGTVRFNLDPLNEVSDSNLTQAFDLCTSSSSFQNYGGTLTLSSPVESEGSNFSHGQRQVISLCRTLARKSKLILLDEATASVDLETDANIQGVLRTTLTNSSNDERCLVTIAHRLRTIMDYDEVVVMGSGKVLEVGSPRSLFKKKGAFYDMIIHSKEQDLGCELE